METLGSEINIESLKALISYVLKTTYRPKDKDHQAEILLQHSLNLFAKDYKFSIIDNADGDLCAHYPSKIIIPEYQVSGSQSANNPDNISYESIYDLNKLKELFKQARFARCRARFPVPVILFEGKNICRGATISGGAEMYGRSGYDFFFSGGGSIPDAEGNPVHTDAPLFDRMRGQDIKLLKYLSLGYICDLMVEKKKVKFGMYVTSSEKVDKEKRYSDFSIVSAPYPGCEFFREWKDNGYMAEGLQFDWSQDQANARLEIPVGLGKLPPPMSIDWGKYKGWDLVNLTKNYLKLLLHYAINGDSGVLLHCISGWDRTPLFVSLLRLSLWADGHIHKSLNASQILYLTVAYDWFLFGHNFPDRMARGEEIFYFCFHFLKYITEDLNVRQRHRRPSSKSSTRADADSHVEGVLLDCDLLRCNYRGSNTSISSMSSKGSVDSCPVTFTVHSTEEDSCHAGVASSSYQSVPAGGSRHHETTYGHHSVHRTQSCTTPMAVPGSRPYSDHGKSPGVGSWQVVSGAGSLRGSVTPHSSSKSSSFASDVSNGHSQPTQSQDSAECPENPRKQKLDAVRRLFISIYCTSIEFKTSPDGNVLSGLLDQFAEKVGFKVMKGSPV